MKPIPGYEGLYSADKDGTIYSHISSRPLKPTPIKGYCFVKLSGKMQSVHRLVMLTFKGECPQGLEVCHNNGNKLDNSLENLRYDTKSNNQRDRRKEGTFKLTETEVKDILWLCSMGWSQTYTASVYNINPSSVNRLVNA